MLLQSPVTLARWFHQRGECLSLADAPASFHKAVAASVLTLESYGFFRWRPRIAGVGLNETALRTILLLAESSFLQPPVMQPESIMVLLQNFELILIFVAEHKQAGRKEVSPQTESLP